MAERQLRLSNLEKPLYPDGFTKAQVIGYYSQLAPLLLPLLAGRPVTFVRYPDGTDGEGFYEKNAAAGAPAWLRTVSLTGSGSRGSGGPVNYPLIDDLPSLVWAANLAALELHVPQWTVTSDGARGIPDRLVFDLDPGEGATVVDCAAVATRIRDALVHDGLTPYATTSGSKGMQLYAGVPGGPRSTSAYAKALAERLARESPDRVTAKMTKALRAGKVFIDWSQNNPAKTTISPYSLRGRATPTVATPVTWDEVGACRREDELVFTAGDVAARVERFGDILAGLSQSGAGSP
ncbi:ATP-dependent DNA ligase [Kibdelosporangium phytohabitans]|uniref:ATP-dependent DNA ligase n=1 Tax=Kibdelosporangium phytohabitans TaxID=860235 RepID=A0A0N9IFW4_9PSEU|nr:ATP-dependent DNA ligase [Kibdelosporangium phytohabitans]